MDDRYMYLPTAPYYEAKKFLVVYLTSIDEPARKKLESLLDSAVASFENDDRYLGQKPLYVPATKHRSQLKKGRLDQVGTLTDLYYVAAETRRKGWERILVVDSRTVRQLQGKTRAIEFEEVSLVLIRTGLGNVSYENDIPVSGDLTADVGRQLVAATVQSILFNDDEIIEKIGHDDYWLFTPWVELYNPDLPLLSADRLGLGQRPATESPSDALKQLQRLPQELIENVLDFANMDPPLERLTAAPQRFDFRKSVVLALSLIPLTEEELSHIDSMIRGAMNAQGSKANLVIYPWLASYDGRRRDLFRLYERVMNNHPGWQKHGWFLFLDRAVLASQPKVGIAFGRRSSKLQAQHILPEHIPDAWESACDRYIHALRGFMMSKKVSVEVLRNPESKYAWDIPAFAGRRSPEDNNIPVFLLNKDITDADIAHIEGKLEAPGDEYHDMTILPWEKQEDGTVDDICRIFQEIDRAYSVEFAVFVDRQTLVDDTVISATSWKHYIEEEDPDIPYRTALLGTQYGRVEAEEIMSMWINLDIGNMDWEEFIEQKDTTFVPLPGVVVPTDPESDAD